MPLTCNVGLSKKAGLPDYGSIGATCNVEFELDSTLLQTDLDAFHKNVHNAYVACAQAVNDELARQQAHRSNGGQRNAAPHEPAARSTPSESGRTQSRTHGNGHERSNGGNGQPATDKQLGYIEQLARQIRGLGARRLDTLATKLFSKPAADVTSFEASSLIDTLKAIKAGEVNLDDALNGATVMSTNTLTQDTLQQRQGGIWDYVSASRLALWAKCPLAFKFRYVDGITSPTTPSLFLGKQVHAALEVLYRNRQLGIALTAEDVVERLSTNWDQAVADDDMKFETVEGETKLKQQVANLVTAYINQVPGDEPKPLTTEVALEAPLIDPATGEDLGVPLVGIVDLVLKGEYGPVVIDFKTAARGGDLLAISHELQLSCYSYLYRQATGHLEAELQIRRLIKTKVPQIDTCSFPARGEKEFNRLFSLVRAYLDDLDRGRFVFRPGFGCGMCDFSEPHCGRWCG